ncbi:signal peptidase I [Pelagibaculum spongiae]|uniref:Signal peptidase I n=1 Tax=Pelagibaculum spongiae TaxID=2080658 RepID=A0A2V1GPI7_9GAMM|nr:signal peptidase I [Pelagibaculum spongiae]PVZ64936.1 signal peptidase I [Pelagibaculum spongiae]
MHFDFEVLLFIAVAFSGLVALINLLILKKKRAVGKNEPLVVEYSRSFFPVLLIVFVFRSFLFEPFRIPSGSMIPTLLVGDFILVNKFAYGVRLPVVQSKVIGWEGDTPQRGDVAVFRYPEDPSQDYIKRVIGLPGDEIRYKDDVVYINDKLMPQKVLGDFSTLQGVAKELMTKTGEKEHDILIYQRNPASGSWKVPEGNYFVLGDNRNNSRDSRYWGYVPQENLVGKAQWIWMSAGGDNSWFEWERIGTRIE